MVYEKKYTWKDGRSFGVSADVVGSVLEEIESSDGAVTKEAFLDASRPEDAPTHKCFEWDDSVAAEKYRLTQSRQIINGIRVTVIKQNDEREDAPAYVNVVPKNPKDVASFVSVGVAMEDDDMRKQVLQNALNDFKALEEKYKHLVELSSIFIAIESAERRLGA